MNRKKVDSFLAKLLADSLVFAPVKSGDKILVEKVKELETVDWSGDLPANSFKSVFLPVEEKMGEFKNGKLISTPEKTQKTVAWGMNILDLQAFALFEQVGGALNLFTKRIVNREFMGWEIPTTWFQALNPLFVIALGPLFAQVWVKLGAAKKEPYTPFKFFLGLLQPSLGFAALAYGASCCTETGLVSIWWLVLAYFLFTTGELCISPVGLAMVTKLAPQKLTGTLMGIWMIGLAYGNYLAGVMSKLASIETQVEDVPADPIGVDGDIPGAVLPDVSIPDIVAQATIYSDAFTTVMYIGLAASVLMLLIVPLLNPVFKREEKMKD